MYKTSELNQIPITELMDFAHNNSKDLENAFIELQEEREQADVTYMKMAYAWANRSKAIRKAVGALVVQNGKIIADGYNGMPAELGDICEIVTLNDKTGKPELTTNPLCLHAEANCFNKIISSSESCNNATIYVTLSPCLECAKKIVGIMTEKKERSIKRAVFHEKYRLEELQQVTALFEKVGIEVVHLQHPELDVEKERLEKSRTKVMKKYFPHLFENAFKNKIK